MPIFDKSKYPDLDPAIAEKIDADIEAAHNEAMTAAKLDFKTKINSVDEKRKAAEDALSKFGDMNPDEIEVLRKARSESGETKAALDALQAKYAEKEAALEAREKEIKSLDFSRKISQTINKYNADNPTVSVRDDAVDLIEMIAGQRRKVDGDSQYFTKRDGTPIVKDSGYGDESAFIEHLRGERPSLFNTPTGGGASGQNNPPTGSAQKTIPISEFDKLSPAKQMEAIRGGVKPVDE